MRRNEIETILSQLLDSYPNVSDINITVGKPFQVESDGELKAVQLKPPVLQLTPFQTEIFAFNLMQGNPQLLQTLLKTGSCDCSYQLGTKARFRVNIFSQRGSYSIVLRKLSSRVPSIAELKLPKIFSTIAEERNGLVLVTGSTGSGKSSSLAALLRHINETKAVHIITLEDPVEFEHTHIKSTINQREVGSDVDSFSSGLRAALREAPKVILVGEMRDRESVEIALTAAETGHLVLSSLHTINAGQTINRILGLFDKEEEDLVRMRLSETLRWVVCQKLVPKITGGRVAVLEIMTRTLRTQEIIAKGESEDKQLYDIISEGTVHGMHTFDQHLLNLFEADLITEEVAKSYCSRKSYVSQGVDRIKGMKGIETNEMPNLEMSMGPKAIRGENPSLIMPTRTIKKDVPMPTATYPSQKLAVHPQATQTSQIPPQSGQMPQQASIQPSKLPNAIPNLPGKTLVPEQKKNFTTQEIVNLELEN